MRKEKRGSKGTNTKNEKVYTQLGNKIKEMREKNDYSRAELARLVKISEGYVGMLERGEKGGSDEFLLELEKVFKLQPQALISLRDEDINNKEVNNVEVIMVNEKQLKDDNFKAEETLDSTPIIEVNYADNLFPDFVRAFVKKLLPLDEKYARKKVAKFLKELQDDYLDQLKPYELSEVQIHVSIIKNKWMNITNRKDSSPKGFIQGCLRRDDHKHYFSIEQNEFALQLNLLQSDTQHTSSFEDWIGPCSVSYITSSHIPNIESEQMFSTLWFNPWVSIGDMYMYLNSKGINIKSMQINDPRLQWYINQKFENELAIAN